MAMGRPLGIGRVGSDEQLWEEYRNLYRNSLDSIMGIAGNYIPPNVVAELYIVKPTSAHNQFINMMLYYGILAVALLVVFYTIIFKGLAIVRRTSSDSFILAVVSGLSGAFVSYIVHSLCHNNGPFFSETSSWFFIGMTTFIINEQTKFFGRDK
jgi:O-antigen ligase